MSQDGEHGEEDQGPGELNDDKRENKKDKRRTDRFTQALSLPSLCNLNPRSIYNKKDEFHTLVKEEDLDVIFLSESWERENLPLDKSSILRTML